jgi:hypothetical protein
MTGGKIVIEMTIQTFYREGVDPTSKSTYGRGDTPFDRARGDTSLRFHEGQHHADLKEFQAHHQVPLPSLQLGMTSPEIKRALEAWQSGPDRQSYLNAAREDTFRRTDCASDATHEDSGYR